MNHRPRSSLRTLLLLLVVVGPLQAQAVFACAMMETVMHGVCCCDEHHSDGLALESGDEPCCDRSVAVTVDQDARHGTPVGKAAEVRSDADPPPAFVSSIDSLGLPQHAVTPRIPDLLPAIGHFGSDTYLITRRLRI